MATGEPTVRLYIGGLPFEITSKQLEGRFASFGRVSAVDLVPSKQHGSASGCRGFAYVDFCPKDDQSLHRCLSLYNGCKWLGGVLRVEKAKEHYLARLHREWVAKSDLEEEEVQEPVDTDHASFQLEPLRIPTPASGFVKRKLMTVNPGPVKRIFAPFKGERPSTLSWDPPPTPPGVRKRRAAEMAAAAFVTQPLSTQQQSAAQPHELPGPPNVVDSTEQNSVLPNTQAAAVPQEEEVQEHPEAWEASSDEGVVDFMSDDDMPEQKNEVTVTGAYIDSLSKFDDSDGDDHTPVDAPVHMQAASVIAVATDLARFDDSSDDEHLQDASLHQKHQADTASATAAAAAAAAPAAAAPDMSRFDDSNDEQMQASPTQQPNAVAAAAIDMSRFDDSEDDDERSEMPTSPRPPWPANSAESLPGQTAMTAAAAGEVSSQQQQTLKSSSGHPYVTADTTMEPASEPASISSSDLVAEPASMSTSVSASEPALADNIQRLTNDPTDSAANGHEPSAAHQASSNPLQQDLEPSPADSSDSDSESGSQSDNDEDKAKPTVGSSDDGSEAESDASGSQASDKVIAEVSMDAAGPMEAAGGVPSDSSQGSQESDLAQQNEASNSAMLTDTAEQAQEVASPQHVNNSAAAAAQVADQDDAPLYPDLMSLRVGAAFWRQQKELSEKAWQAQRQVLHADYRAKHRAAAKHTHKANKPRHG